MTELYTTQDGKVFTILKEYTQDNNDPWVEYINTQTNQTYTARKEAFLARTQLQLKA